MVQGKPASLYLLQQQVEVYMSDTTSEVYRSISYDNGNNWYPWKKINIATINAIGCASSGNARARYIVYRTMDSKFNLVKKDEYGYDQGSTNVMGSGSFASAPSLVCTPDGNSILAFGLGNDLHYWWAISRDGGNSWQTLWAALGTGTFKTAPAAVMSDDGNVLLIFGIGTDNRVWYAQSSDGGNNWNVLYGPISTGTFMSPPAACISADGNKVMVVGCGMDRKFYYNESTDKGITWGSFQPIGTGIFSSGPSVCCSWDRSMVHVFGVGTDKKMWRAIRDYKGSIQWQGWWQMDPGIDFINY